MPSKTSPKKQQKSGLNTSRSPSIYPDIEALKNDNGMSDGDGSFTKHRDRSQYEYGESSMLHGSYDDDSDYMPNESIEENSSSSSLGDIPQEELELLEKDRAKPPIDVHGRGSIHKNESPAWKLRSGRGRRTRDNIVDRDDIVDERHQWSGTRAHDPATGRFVQQETGHVHKRVGNISRCEKTTAYLAEVSDDSGSFPCADTSTDRMFTPNVIGLMIIFVLIIALVALLRSGRISPVPQGVSRPNFVQLKYGVQRIRENFEKQESRLWTSLLSSSLPLFDEPPLKPGVVVIAYSGSDVTARCLTSLFAAELSRVFGAGEPLVIADGLTTKSKRALDLALRKGFENGVKVAIFPHLEKFDRDTLLLMHDFCDDQYAPFKDVLLVFLTSVPEDVDKRRIEDHLSDLFRVEVGEDEAGALISRVVRNVAKVKVEDHAALRGSGCVG